MASQNNASGTTTRVTRAAAAMGYIQKLPKELIGKIAKELDPVSAASFGVTFKTAYEMSYVFGSNWQNENGKVKLADYLPGTPGKYVKGGSTLANLLRSWIPKKYVYNHTRHAPSPGKFITKKRFQRVERILHEEVAAQALDDFCCEYPGLDNDDHDKLVDKYMREVKKDGGFEYEDYGDGYYPAKLTASQQRKQDDYDEFGY